VTEATNENARKTRVLHVAKGLGPGGAERLIVNQMLERDTDAYDYEVAYLLAYKNHLVPLIEDAGVPATLIEGHSWPFRLASYVRTGRFDIVHVHSPVVASALRTLRQLRRFDARIVTTEHNRWPRHHQLTRLVNRATYRFDDATIAVSDEVKDSVAANLRRRVEVIHHGIPLQTVRGLRSSRNEVRSELSLSGVVVGIVANFRPEKAYDVFLDATIRASKAQPDLHWVAVGQGPGLDEFREAVRLREMADRITVTGYRADAVRVMAGFDVFTLSSRHEGLPVSVMEALALGLPVVATRAGGIPEAITHECEGLLVSIDDAGALADAWIRVARDVELRTRLGQAAVSAAARFDAGVSTREIESAYRRLMIGSG
jgi:glycosyltransferase involved in cell wall biosynthesis